MIDFNKSNGSHGWRVLNDNVMGGLSSSQIDLTDNSMKIEGRVSLANNGGFSSIRSAFNSYDLSNYSAILIRLRGDGQSFSFTLETDRRWFYPYYKQDILLEDTQWHTVKLPLNMFQSYRVGRQGSEMLTDSKLSEIIRLGIVTNEKKEGAYELEIDFIAFE